MLIYSVNTNVKVHCSERNFSNKALPWEIEGHKIDSTLKNGFRRCSFLLYFSKTIALIRKLSYKYTLYSQYVDFNGNILAAN
jgi:hypothetical protein